MSTSAPVKPGDSMREQGKRYTQDCGVAWTCGSGEKTGLPSGSLNWATMASSFHWVKQPEGLREFHRILKPGGFLTVLWNPRDIESSALSIKVEELMQKLIPDIKRVSSGHEKSTRDWPTELTATGHFEDVIFLEARHQIVMSKERYLGAWRSVNDIQAQAGPKRFEDLMSAIESLISSLPELVMPYRTRAWTARRIES